MPPEDNADRITELETEVLDLRRKLGAKNKAAVQRIEEQQQTIAELLNQGQPNDL